MVLYSTYSTYQRLLLLDGRVLITGGIENYGLASCEIYNPLTNKFTQAANMSIGRYWNTATLNPTTGEVLVCGGRNLEDLFNSCEILMIINFFFFSLQ